MREVMIGDSVETNYGVNGILTAVNLTAFIATADGRTFYCPISDLKDCIFGKCDNLNDFCSYGERKCGNGNG
jgi:hypothetical protein|nr:MAG TPA: hypothetical protein [Caudoviricetes sp.]